MAAIPHRSNADVFLKWTIMSNYLLFPLYLLHNINSSDQITVVHQADVQQERAAEEMERCVFAHRPARDAALPGQVRFRRRLDVFFRPELQRSGRGETPL